MYGPPLALSNDQPSPRVLRHSAPTKKPKSPASHPPYPPKSPFSHHDPQKRKSRTPPTGKTSLLASSSPTLHRMPPSPSQRSSSTVQTHPRSSTIRIRCPSPPAHRRQSWRITQRRYTTPWSCHTFHNLRPQHTTTITTLTGTDRPCLSWIPQNCARGRSHQ